MATGCSNKEFETKFDKEMYYDAEFETFCSTFEFAVSALLLIFSPCYLRHNEFYFFCLKKTECRHLLDM